MKITAPDNIRAAFARAAKGKGRMASVQKFAANLDANLENVRRLLLEKTYRTSPYTRKKVFEPKERELFVLPFAPDRIVHHALMNVLAPIWAGLFISDSYACIPGRGVHSGSRRTMEFVRKNRYALKCDVSKFYPSIDHAVLLSIIERKIKCPDTLWLIREIVASVGGGKNAPIGNYTSQWFGNLYMNELDTYAKTVLGCRNYIRYNDDFCVFHDDKKFLHDRREKIGEFLSVKLKLSFSCADVFPVSRGVDFLGYRHFDNYILCRKSTAKRVKKRLEKLPGLLARGGITAEQFRSSVGSTWGWLKHANSHNLAVAVKFDELRKEAQNHEQIFGVRGGRHAAHGREEGRAGDDFGETNNRSEVQD